MSETKPSEDKHYLIIGAATKEIIGCTTGDSGVKDVLSEEPANTEFREVEESACPVCKADEWESRPEGMVDPCMSQRVQPTTCPTCGSDRRDFCVGHCPDNWHGNGPISNVCVVDSTGKVVYPNLPKVERYGYIGESGLTRYRVQYDTDGVGRSLYRDATPEEVAGFLAEKEANLVEAAELLKAKKERKIMHTEQEKDRARECANLVLECCADIYEYGRVSGLPSDMSDALESATCKILAYHDEQSQIYKDEITRLQGELESEYRRGRRDAG